MQNAEMGEQLQNFAFRINRFFYDGKAKLKPKNWLDAFQMLIIALEKQAHTEKMVIFFDELPWFDSRKSGFLRALGFFWNSWCVDQNIRGGKNQNPRAGTIRNTVLGGSHWTPPNYSVADAKKYIAQIAQTAQMKVAQIEK